jgi:D-threo-aldose 1-dehydrogenase
VIAGGEHYEYQKASPQVRARVQYLNEVAARHGVDIKAAALQFSLAHPAVAAVIPGATRPQHADPDLAALKAVIPAAFWAELQALGLIAQHAPLPA